MSHRNAATAVAAAVMVAGLLLPRGDPGDAGEAERIRPDQGIDRAVPGGIVTDAGHEPEAHLRLRQTLWLMERGYLDNGYRHYDSAALRIMAESDHRPALEELARRYAASDPQQAIQPGWRAAVLGSTSGLLSLAKARVEQARLASLSTPDTHGEASLHAMIAAAHAVTALWLGDPGGKAIVDVLLALNLLTNDDMPGVCEAAGGILQELQASRHALGLPPLTPQPPSLASTDLGASDGFCARTPGIECRRRAGMPASTDLDAWTCSPAG